MTRDYSCIDVRCRVVLGGAQFEIAVGKNNNCTPMLRFLSVSLSEQETSLIPA